MDKLLRVKVGLAGEWLRKLQLIMLVLIAFIKQVLKNLIYLINIH